jgi:hypothetical protein
LVHREKIKKGDHTLKSDLKTTEESIVSIDFELFLMISLPLFSYWWLDKNYNRLSEAEFELKYGTLYTNVDINKWSSSWITTIFCLRRLLICIFTIHFNSYLILNIYVTIYSSIFILFFYINVQPFKTRFLNRIEILNEIGYLSTNYFMFLFTDFINDIEFRYQVGKAQIYMVICIFTFNLVLIGAEMFDDFKKMFYKGTLKSRIKQNEIRKEQLLDFYATVYAKFHHGDQA